MGMNFWYTSGRKLNGMSLDNGFDAWVRFVVSSGKPLGQGLVRVVGMIVVRPVATAGAVRILVV